MPFDLQVPKRFTSSPAFREVSEGVPFGDAVKVPIPCDDPKRSVVTICLDTDKLRVGDVFLFHSQTPGGKMIELYQKRWCGLSAFAAKIAHVAIYTGSGMIWDHNPNQNIRMRTLSSAFELGITISVSRPKTDKVDRVRLVEICSHLQGQSNYSLQTVTNWRAVMARANRVRFDKRMAGSEIPRALVCSTFVSSVLDYATRNTFSIPEPVVLPGDFMRGDLFERLDIEWSCFTR